jgi:hypothetical protein
MGVRGLQHRCNTPVARAGDPPGGRHNRDRRQDEDTQDRNSGHVDMVYTVISMYNTL